MPTAVPNPVPTQVPLGDPSAREEVVAGLVERITFHNADNGFCVLGFEDRGQATRSLCVAARPKRTPHRL